MKQLLRLSKTWNTFLLQNPIMTVFRPFLRWKTLRAHQIWQSWMRGKKVFQEHVLWTFSIMGSAKTALLQMNWIWGKFWGEVRQQGQQIWTSVMYLEFCLGLSKMWLQVVLLSPFFSLSLIKFALQTKKDQVDKTVDLTYKNGTP